MMGWCSRTFLSPFFLCDVTRRFALFVFYTAAVRRCSVVIPIKPLQHYLLEEPFSSSFTTELCRSLFILYLTIYGACDLFMDICYGTTSCQFEGNRPFNSC